MKDSRNAIKVFYVEKEKEKCKEIFLEGYDWRKDNPEDFISVAERLVKDFTDSKGIKEFDWCFSSISLENNNFELLKKSHLMQNLGRFNQSYKIMYDRLNPESVDLGWLFYETSIKSYVLEGKTNSACWLLPDGSEIGCDFGKHSSLLEFALGMKEEEAENLGWIRINRHGDGYYHIQMVKYPTLMQSKFLDKLQRNYFCKVDKL